MVHIEGLNLLIQGVSFSLFFMNYQEGIIKKWFFMLGQIIALPIIYITHGPECFHELFVDHLFGIQDGGKCSDYSNFNGAIRHYIKEIKGKKMIVCWRQISFPKLMSMKILTSFARTFTLLCQPRPF